MKKLKKKHEINRISQIDVVVESFKHLPLGTCSMRNAIFSLAYYA